MSLIHRFLSVSLPLLLTGCLATNSLSYQFYLLEPLTNADKPLNETPKLVIALQTVRIPKYVDRPQIVQATAPNTYQLSEAQRWAEALDENITRVLAQNLTQLLAADVLFSSHTNLAKQAGIRLSVNILEFHVTPEAQAKLNVQWQISQEGGVVSSQQSSYQANASNSDYPAMISALNDCLNRMSRDIAKSIATAHQLKNTD